MKTKNQPNDETALKPCSYCEREFQGTKGLRIHMATVHDEQTVVTVRCNWCGTPVEAREWETDQHHYCRRICGKAWTTYLQLGERHPNYTDGTSRGRDFRWIANAIRMRDGCCLRCGNVDAGESGRALHVHHIVPEETLRAADEDPHDPTNLISVCGPCHRTLEGMAPESQRAECGTESPEELVLTGEAAAWIETFDKKYKVLNVAPDPWPGMFAEAQRHLADRD